MLLRNSNKYHLCKHSVLIDGAVLHTALAAPDDLLMLLEAAVQQEYLQDDEVCYERGGKKEQR